MLVQIRRVGLFAVVLFFIILSIPSTVYAKKVSRKKKERLNETSLSIKEDESFQLKVVNKGKKKVKWSTSKSSVATVTKNGKVVAKQKGSCNIKAKVGGKTLTCKVVVKERGEIAPVSTIQAVVNLVNHEREVQGKKKLVIDKTLCEIAQQRAHDLTEKFSHTRPNGDNCFELFDEYDYEFYSVGENIAAGQKCESEVVTDWLNSPGHRRNIMNQKFNKIGIGFVKDEDSVYGYHWVQVFSN